MKRLALILLVALSLTGCATQTDVDEAYEKGYKLGYNEGYDQGYGDGLSDGKQEAYNIEYVYYNKGFWDGAMSGVDADEYFEFMSSNAPTSAKAEKTRELHKLQPNAPTEIYEDKQINKQATANAWRDPNWDGQPVYYEPESSDYDSIFTYGTDADSILDYIRDNPHEFNLYTEGDMCDAHEAGANGEDWIVR